MKKIADRIKEYREASNLTKSALAEQTGLTPSAITQFENGDREPSLESIKKLAKTLNVSVSRLVGEEVDNNFKNEPELMAMFREIKKRKLKPEDKKALQGVLNVFLKWKDTKPKK